MSSINTRSATSEYLASLTGLRAWAALLVFAYHHYTRWDYRTTETDFFLSGGLIGVSIFFSLSGFLLARGYMSLVRAGQFQFNNYWFRRLIRIYPLYLVVLAYKAYWQSGYNFSHLFAHASLAHAYFGSTLWTGIGPAWSLSVELTFYLLLPLVLLTAHQIHARPGSSGAGKYILLFLGLSGAFWLAGWLLYSQSGFENFLSSPYMVRGHSIFGRFAEFGVGVFLALVMEKRESADRKASSPSDGNEDRLLPEIAFVFALLLTGWAMRELGTQLHKNNVLISDLLSVHWIHAIGTAALLWSCWRGSVLATRIFGNPVAEYLGRVSYAFYLIQDDLTAEQIRALVVSVVGEGNDVFGVKLVFFLAVAILLHELVEKPTHRLLIEYFRNRRNRNPSVTPTIEPPLTARART